VRNNTGAVDRPGHVFEEVFPMADANPTAFDHIIHIGVVVRDMDAAIARFAALGIGPFTPRILPPENIETFRGKPFVPAEHVSIQITRVGNMELELIQPVAGESPHQEWLDARGEGVQHLGFRVDDLSAAVSDLTAAGSEVTLTSRFPDGGGVAYLDLHAANLIVELVQPGPR
jgi:methylmalonyl-CoA/ethylmalonyl-CoA epimerase